MLVQVQVQVLVLVLVLALLLLPLPQLQALSLQVLELCRQTRKVAGALRLLLQLLAT